VLPEIKTGMSAVIEEFKKISLIFECSIEIVFERVWPMTYNGDVDEIADNDPLHRKSIEFDSEMDPFERSQTFDMPATVYQTRHNLWPIHERRSAKNIS
jgi:hypothetical protein